MGGHQYPFSHIALIPCTHLLVLPNLSLTHFHSHTFQEWTSQIQRDGGELLKAAGDALARKWGGRWKGLVGAVGGGGGGASAGAAVESSSATVAGEKMRASLDQEMTAWRQPTDRPIPSSQGKSNPSARPSGDGGSGAFRGREVQRPSHSGNSVDPGVAEEDMMAAAAAAAAQLEAALAGAPSPQKGPMAPHPSSSLSEDPRVGPPSRRSAAREAGAPPPDPPPAPPPPPPAPSPPPPNESPHTLAASLGQMILDSIFPPESSSGAATATSKHPARGPVAEAQSSHYHAHKPSVDFDVLMNVRPPAYLWKHALMSRTLMDHEDTYCLLSASQPSFLNPPPSGA